MVKIGSVYSPQMSSINNYKLQIHQSALTFNACFMLQNIQIDKPVDGRECLVKDVSSREKHGSTYCNAHFYRCCTSKYTPF